MIRSIAIDDEKSALEVLQHHAKAIPYLQLEQTFRDPLQAVEWLHANPVELIFLDINMPTLDGIQLKKLLPSSAKVIFTTAYSEYALKSYELDALDYLLKPIEFGRFLQALNKVQRLEQKHIPAETPATDPQQESIFIKSGNEFHRIRLDQLLYVESDGNYVHFHTTDRKIMSRSKLSEVAEMLPDNRFLRVHRSFIVAAAFVEVFKTHELEIGGKSIPVGSSYREEVMQRLLN
jgi:two-component system, LytTR family, response regulator